MFNLMKPNKTKYNLHHRALIPTTFKYEPKLLKGKYGLIAVNNGIITNSELSSCLLAIKRVIKQNGNLIMRIFPNISVTKRPPEQTLGRGKGSIDKWVTPVKGGTILFEIDSNYCLLAKQALLAAKFKLNIKSRILTIN